MIQQNKNRVLFSMMMWSIQDQRNQVQLNKTHCALNLIASSAKDRLDEFTKAQPDPSPPQQKTRVSQQPPPIDLFKINYDGTTFKHEEKFRINVVIWDSSSQPIVALSQQIPRAYNAVEIEAIAATKALEFAREVGINNVVMVGDSWLVHHALINDEKSLSPFGLLTEDVKFFFQLFQ